MPARIFKFLPAILAAVTDVLASWSVSLRQPLPVEFVIFQVVMVGVALLMALPVRWVWFPAFLIMLAGAFVTGFSVGMFYIPTVIAAGWVMVRRLERSGSDQVISE